MKKNLLFFVFIFSSIAAKAQGDYNYSPLGIGFGSSIIRGYTNLAKQDNTLAFFANFNYYYSPYVPLTAEVQAGRLIGGSVVTDPSHRAYTNNYVSFTAHGDLQLGELIDYSYNGFLNVVKNFYIGPGGGFIFDNVKNQRYDPVDQGYPAGTYRFPGKDQSTNLLVSLRAGYEFKIYNDYGEPYLRVDIEYTHNVVFGEGLDGYDDPSNQFKNSYPDQYRQISIGIVYTFGLIRAYTKPIGGL